MPSLADFLLNTFGAWVGSVLASALEHLGWLRRWSQFRERWFVRDAYMALVLMAVWPVALLFPVAVPLGLGQVWERVEDALTSAFDATPFENWIPLRAFELEPLLPGAELLCVMLALIVYASLYPFDQWRDQGIWSWSFLAAPWPKYWLGFDVVANVLGYAPLGFLLTLSAMRMGWRTRVVTVTTFAAAVLSLAMEGLQSYLPARVPSLADFLLTPSALGLDLY